MSHSNQIATDCNFWRKKGFGEEGQRGSNEDDPKFEQKRPRGLKEPKKSPQDSPGWPQIFFLTCGTSKKKSPQRGTWGEFGQGGDKVDRARVTVGGATLSTGPLTKSDRDFEIKGFV